MNNIYPIDPTNLPAGGPRLERSPALVNSKSQREVARYAERYNGIIGSIRLMIDEFRNEKEYCVIIDKPEIVGLIANVLYFLLSFSMFLYFYFNGFQPTYVDKEGKKASDNQLKYNSIVIYIKDGLSALMVMIVAYKTYKRIKQLSEKKINKLKNGLHSIYVSQRRNTTTPVDYYN